MDHKYIQSISNDMSEATMFLHGEIGCEVNGSSFAQEVQYLEQAGTKILKVRVNSGGGKVIDAYSIFSALHNTTMEVTTINEGIAASSAGWCWLAGNNCLMMDYSIFMLHNTSSDNDDNDILNLFDGSIRKIIASKTGLPEDQIGELMANETFMDSSEMINKGFIKNSSVIKTSKKPKIVVNDAKSIYTICNQFLKGNDEIENKKIINKMLKVTNLLELQNEASEDAIAEKVNGILTDNKSKENELLKLENENAELKAKVASFELAESAKKELAAIELVENAITAGKIESESKDSWLKIANSSYEDCKAALDAFKVALAPEPIKHANILNKLTLTANNAVKGREDWDIRKWEVEDPKGLLALKNSTPLEYDRMFNAFYIKSK